jgi:hypothetical protein
MLVNDYLDPNFRLLYEKVRASRNADVPIFLNYYDTPVARNAPAPPGRKAWLYAGFTKNSIPQDLWPDMTAGIFNDLQTTIARWTQGTEKLYVVPTDGALIPAEPDATGSSGDWINEIHPNAAGWKKLAAIWLRTFQDNL